MTMEKNPSADETQGNMQRSIALGYDERIIREYDCGVTPAGFKGKSSQKLIITNKRVAMRSSSCHGKDKSVIYRDIPIKSVKGVNVSHGIATTAGARPILIILLIVTLIAAFAFLMDDDYLLAITFAATAIWQIVLIVRNKAKVSRIAYQIEFLTDRTLSSSLELGADSGAVEIKRVFRKNKTVDFVATIVDINFDVVEEIANEIGAIIQNSRDGYYDEYL